MLKLKDNTPTWIAVMWSCLDVIENGNNAEAKSAVRKELVHMAKLADLYVAEHKN